jgi:hypothetical protein
MVFNKTTKRNPFELSEVDECCYYRCLHRLKVIFLPRSERQLILSTGEHTQKNEHLPQRALSWAKRMSAPVGWSQLCPGGSSWVSRNGWWSWSAPALTAWWNFSLLEKPPSYHPSAFLKCLPGALEALISQPSLDILCIGSKDQRNTRS